MTNSATGATLLRIGMTAVGLAMLSAAMTVLFLAMRVVMDMGGSCASGGPYEIARPCPDGVAFLMPLAIFGGLAGLGIYLAGSSRLPGPRLALFAWPVLFLSLGWNFWEYGLNPPGNAAEIVWAWVICGAVFVIMGAFPLLALASPGVWRGVFWADAPADPQAAGREQAQFVASSLRPTRTAAAPRYRPAPASPPAGVAADLERVARLHHEGALTDDEFRAAKQRILGGSDDT